MGESNVLYTLESVIENMRGFIEQHGKATRNEYRAAQGKGALPESAWGKYFKTFKDFKAAAESTIPKVESTATEKHEFKDEVWEVSMPKTSIHTLDELLAHCKVDLSIWKVERFIVNTWNMGAKINDKIEVTPLFQVKATLVKKEEIVDAKAEIEALKFHAEHVALIPTPVLRTNRASGNMLEISLFDAHFGKMSWSKETGGPDYDLKIAQSTFLKAVESLLDKAKGYNFDSTLLVTGNDLLHSDDLQGRTTKGTVVSTDTRYQKTFEVVRETISKTIERLRQIAPVTVKMVQGNHDELSVWHLGDSLSCLYRNYDDVVIDNAPTLRKYHQWGNNGFLFCHGDKGKRSDYPLLFATERSDIFGVTKFREVHTGHYHQTKTEEFHGVRVRIIPSLSPSDSWHAAMGFTGQQRVGEAYVFHKTDGLTAQFFYNADA
jgi:hypothetical protein